MRRDPEIRRVLGRCNSTILDNFQGESGFQDAVIELAESQGWVVYHFHDSRRQVRRGDKYVTIGDKQAMGWPDLVLIHRGRPSVLEPMVLFRELKKGGLKDKYKAATPEQMGTLEILGDAGEDVGVWAPEDWPEIEKILIRGK